MAQVQIIVVRYNRRDPTASAPYLFHRFDGSMLLYSVEEVVIEPQQWRFINTELNLTFPPWFYGRVTTPPHFTAQYPWEVYPQLTNQPGSVRILLRNTTPRTQMLVRGEAIARVFLDQRISGPVALIDNNPPEENSESKEEEPNRAPTDAPPAPAPVPRPSVIAFSPPRSR